MCQTLEEPNTNTTHGRNWQEFSHLKMQTTRHYNQNSPSQPNQSFQTNRKTEIVSRAQPKKQQKQKLDEYVWKINMNL